jgi:hypothetical protein
MRRLIAGLLIALAACSSTPMAKVYVARVNIPKTTDGDVMLSKKMVELATVPRSQLKPDAITLSSQISGRLAIVSVPAGAQLIRTDMAVPSVPNGQGSHRRR